MENISENKEIKTLEDFLKISWVFANSMMKTSTAMADIVMKSTVYEFLKLNKAIVNPEEEMREYKNAIEEINLNKLSIDLAIDQMERYIEANLKEEHDSLINSLSGLIRIVNSAAFSVEYTVRIHVENGKKPDISVFYNDFKRSVSRLNKKIIDKVNIYKT